MFANSPTLTDEQQKALSTTGSTVLSAGAGCGKTFVLTQRFLGYLTEVPLREIAAITFTERAAREMRQRIREHLQHRGKTEPNGPWEHHLTELDAATITTIHSFCGNLIRQYAIELGFDPQFEILDEMLSVNLQRDAIRDSLHHLLISNTDTADDLRSLVVVYGWQYVVTGITELVQQRDMPAWEEWLKLSAQQVVATWQQHHDHIIQQKVTEFVQSTAVKQLLDLMQTHECLNPKLRDRLILATEQINQLTQSTNLIPDLATLRESLSHREREASWKSAEVYRLATSIVTACRQLHDDFFKETIARKDHELLPVAEIATKYIRVAVGVVEDYQRYKKSVGVADFDDLLNETYRLLQSQPEVLEQIRQRYRRLLLDEMQDTDPVQMAIVRLLSNDLMHDERLFAVGDMKQSIYRFRGAEVALFQELRHAVPESNRLPLSGNFRSERPILDFVNTLFSQAFPTEAPLTTNWAPTASGHIHFWWTFREDSTATELREAEADSIARKIGDLLNESQAIIHNRHQQARPVQLGDIVILFRSMSNVMIYENALRRAGLDYYVVGGRAFFAQQEVYDILNLLRAIDNPDDSLAMTGVLRSPFACISDATLMRLNRLRKPIWAALFDDDLLNEIEPKQRLLLQRIRDLLQRWHTIKDRIPMTVLLHTVIQDSGYDAALQLEQMGERQLANLWKLIEIARKFDRAAMFRLADFIAQLAAMVSTELREEQAATMPENANVIRLMSVHQSKGLEFPIVILPDVAAQGGRADSYYVRWHRQLGCVVAPPKEEPAPFSDSIKQLANTLDDIADFDEEQRIFYVACTRAKNRLILSGSFDKPFAPSGEGQPLAFAKSKNPWFVTLNSRFQLQTGRSLDTTTVSPPATVEMMFPNGQEKRRATPQPITEPISDQRIRPSSSAVRVITFNDVWPDEHAAWREELVQQHGYNSGIITVEIDGLIIRADVDDLANDGRVLILDPLNRALVRCGIAIASFQNGNRVCMQSSRANAIVDVDPSAAHHALHAWIQEQHGA